MTLSVYIGDKKIDDVLSVSIQRNLDYVVGTATITLPYHKKFQFKRWDAIKIYYGDKILMNGFLTDRRVSLSRHDASITLRAEDAIGIAKFRNIKWDYDKGYLSQRLVDIFYRLNPWLSVVPLDIRLYKDVVVNFNSQQSLIDFFRMLKEEMGLWVYSTRDGTVVVQSPSWLFDNEVPAWEFKYGDNIFSIDIQNTLNFIWAVVIVGNRCNGVALDVFTREVIGGDKTNGIEIIQRYDIYDQEEADEVARNILIQRNKEAFVTIDVPFRPDYNLTDYVLIKNIPDEIPEDRKFFITSVEHHISSSDIHTTLKLAYSPLLTMPDRITKERDKTPLDLEVLTSIGV
jgi:hypothetical protein